MRRLWALVCRLRGRHAYAATGRYIVYHRRDQRVRMERLVCLRCKHDSLGPMRDA